jgi:hypothetical protein
MCASMISHPLSIEDPDSGTSHDHRFVKARSSEEPASLRYVFSDLVLADALPWNTPVAS